MDFAFIAAGVTGALEWTMAAGAVASLLRGGDVARRADPGTGCSTTGCIPIRVRRRYRRERLLFLEADGVLLCPNRGNAQARANARRRRGCDCGRALDLPSPPPRATERTGSNQPTTYSTYLLQISTRSQTDITVDTDRHPVRQRRNRQQTRWSESQRAVKQTTDTDADT